MKRVLLFAFALATFSLSAQTIVSTTPENKNVVLEEYTGINCGYCPGGHEIGQNLLDANPDDVVLVNIHVGGYANPSAGQPDFRTPWGGALDSQADVAGYPAGSVNRHVFPGMEMGSGSAMSRDKWNTAANQIFAEASYLNVGCEATVISSTRQLVVNVEVYYTGDSPVENNYLTVAMLQNNIIGYQSDYVNGTTYTYNHMHMLRHFLTGQWGAEITETSEGSLYTASFYYEVPADYNDIEVALENLEIVAYVAEGHEEIISGSMAEVTLIESLDLDAGIIDYNIPQTNCGEEVTPKLTIKNFGTDALNSLDFEYSVNGGEAQTHSWTGTLAQNESESIELPSLLIDGEEENTFSLISNNPNGSTDELPANNEFEMNFTQTEYLPQGCKVAILTDGNPEETTWDIKNSSGEIIASGGPYTVTTIFVEAFEWTSNDCFTFTIYDEGGNGLDGGFYRIVNSSNQLIWEGNTDFGFETSAQFSYDENVGIGHTELSQNFSVYPNPMVSAAQVDFSLLQQSTVQLSIYNLLGKRIIQIHEGILPMGNYHMPLQANNLENGVYLLKLTIDGQEQVQKIQIIK